MSCNYCHESEPRNRHDGFCSDICLIHWLRTRNAKLLAAHHEIAEWARAYPIRAFPEPDFAKAAELLKAGGMTLDAISASNMRHVVTTVAKIANAAIAKAEEK